MLVERKQFDEAETFLIQGIRKDNKNAVNYLHLGAVYAAKKKYRLAIENFEKFLDLAPRNDPDRGRARNAIQDGSMPSVPWFDAKCATCSIIRISRLTR